MSLRKHSRRGLNTEPVKGIVSRSLTARQLGYLSHRSLVLESETFLRSYSSGCHSSERFQLKAQSKSNRDPGPCLCEMT